MEDQGAITKVLLANSLHTPHLRSNLISVSKLVFKGASVSFEGERAIVRNAQGLKVFSAIRMDGLYIVNVTHTSAAHTAQVGKGSVPYEIWHRHLGHVPVNVISQMEKGDLVDGLNASGEARLKALCEDCLFGKQTTHPFNNTVTRETSVLECVYVDIWGPANVQSAGGAKYFMLCMDGASLFRKVFFIASKTAEVTLQIFREFHVESERQTGKKLKRVRLDMGREWCNSLWNRYAKDNGIILDFAMPYAHQQNGRAERSMCTLLDMGRSMLADACLPQKYWADAVRTAAYIRNFIPPASDPTSIPAEHWSQKRQDVSHLRAFGCICYAHVPVEISPSKLAPRSVRLTLIGYFEHAGYKLLDKSTGKTSRSRDVVFDEQLPHYSMDQSITYPVVDQLNTVADTTAIAPCPNTIPSLHPAPASKESLLLSTPPATISKPTPSAETNHNSETEVSQLLAAPPESDESLAA
jgi:hypothetical protein